MIETNKVFTDFEFSQNPDASPKINKFYRVFMPFLGLVWIIVGSVNLGTNDSTDILNIIQIVLGVIVLVTFVTQPLFYKKFGRKYIEFGNDRIEIKKKYLKKPIIILWDNIAKVKFQYSKFMIYQSNNQENVIIFEVPYSKNEEIRLLFRKFAKLKSCAVEE